MGEDRCKTAEGWVTIAPTHPAPVTAGSSADVAIALGGVSASENAGACIHTAHVDDHTALDAELTLSPAEVLARGGTDFAEDRRVS